jgi:hypothetical protein
MAHPIGANFSLAEEPDGDWGAELAAGFGVPRVSGYFFADWYQESHNVARVIRGSEGGAGGGSNGTSTTVQLEDWSRYGLCEALEHVESGCAGTAPGRFTVTGLLSEVDEPGEWWYDAHARLLYIYPLPSYSSTDNNGTGTSTGSSAVRLGMPHAGTFLTLENTSWVTFRDVTMSGSTVHGARFQMKIYTRGCH